MLPMAARPSARAAACRTPPRQPRRRARPRAARGGPRRGACAACRSRDLRAAPRAQWSIVRPRALVELPGRTIASPPRIHPHELALHRVPAQAPLVAVEGQEAADQPAPDQTALDQVLPDHVLPDHVLPDHVLPVQVLPDHVLPAIVTVSLPKEPAFHWVLLKEPVADQADRLAAAFAMVEEFHCPPKMSSSPQSVEPSLVRLNPLRADSRLPLPLPAPQVCTEFDGVKLEAVVRLISPDPCAVVACPGSTLAVDLRACLTSSGVSPGRCWRSRATPPLTTADACDVPLPRRKVLPTIAPG